MEVDKNKLNKNTKAILTYCLLVLLFLIFNNHRIFVPITIPVIDIILYCSDLNQNIRETNADLISFLVLVFIIRHIYIYITAIFCGIFKKINNLKLYEEISIILLVNMGLYYFCIGRIYGQQLYAHVSLLEAVKDYFFWVFPLYFLIYKFWGYITKNSVINFEKIEYYMSIDFLMDLFFKIKEKLKELRK